MERQKNDDPINRRPARSRRQIGCIRPKGPAKPRYDARAGETTPEEPRERRRQAIEPTVARTLRMARRRDQRTGLDLGRLQRQVARRGGSLRIVIEFPATPAANSRRPHGGPRKPRFV